MSIIKKTNSGDLTDEEIQFLRGSTVPAEVRQYLARQHENIGTKYSAYRKVAAAARAECDAILATRDLEVAKGEWVQIEQARSTIEQQRRRIAALEGVQVVKDASIRSLTAAPALAVHSED